MAASEAGDLDGACAGAVTLGAAGGPPLVAQVIHRFDVGGLENGVVNLVNGMAPERYRHAIVALTEATEFRCRLQRDGVPIHCLYKREGKDLGLYVRLWRLFRALRPAIVHTRNMAALEAVVPAYFAGVPCRIHGEHGWDMLDPEGRSRKYRAMRRVLRPLVHHYIPLSGHIERYLRDGVGVLPGRMTRIANGVDIVRFHPACEGREAIGPPGFAPPGSRVIGTVGRMQAVKDPLNLVRAFVALLAIRPELRDGVRLAMVGDGPLRAEASRLLAEAGHRDRAWLPGSLDEVPRIMRGLDLFVLPSLAEGISNTLLEAMACGLPAVATAVGGNAELVLEGETGRLVPPADAGALSRAIAGYLDAPGQMAAHGLAARRRVEERFSIDQMVQAYTRVYDRVASASGVPLVQADP